MVNQVETDKLSEELTSLCKEGGFELTESQIGLLVRHLLLVEEKNQVTNLTRITNLDEALSRHIIDSLLFVDPIREHADEAGHKGYPLRLLDLGTGAGYPGIPLLIVMEAQGTLLDSVGKKVAAVSEFLQELGLEDRAQALHMRVEDLARQVGPSYDIVTARAVASLATLVEYAAPLLVKGGILVASKGMPEDSEINQGNKAAKVCGMKLVSRETQELPDGQGHRELFVYRKVAQPKVKLPRQSGQAKRNPLA